MIMSHNGEMSLSSSRSVDADGWKGDQLPLPCPLERAKEQPWRSTEHKYIVVSTAEKWEAVIVFVNLNFQHQNSYFYICICLFVVLVWFFLFSVNGTERAFLLTNEA